MIIRPCLLPRPGIVFHQKAMGSFISRPLSNGNTRLSKGLPPIPEHPPVLGQTAAHPRFSLSAASDQCTDPHQSFIRFKALVVAVKRTLTCPWQRGCPRKPSVPCPCPCGLYQTLWLVASNPVWLTAEAHQSTCNLKRAYVLKAEAATNQA
jgi:hypothetical protein